MESIDRMREYAETKCGWGVSPEAARRIKEFTDAIEREVEQYVVAEIDAMPMTDENMAAAGWMRLPVDADGVPIHVGDVMENIVCPPVHREVTGVGVECFYGWDEGNGRYSQFDVVCYRHHHTPTVEGLLREYAIKCEEAGNSGPEVKRLAAEYAAKLQLKED